MNKLHLGIVAVTLMLGLSVVGHAQTLSVTNGLTLQLKADGLLYSDSGGTTLATDGSTVGLWKDAVGIISGADAKDVGYSLPTFHANVLNGKPVVRFDGTETLSTTAAGASILPNANWTTFAVFLATSVSARDTLGYNSQAVFRDTGGNMGMPVDSTGGAPKVYGYAYSGAALPAQTFTLNQFTFAVAEQNGLVLSIQSAGAGSGSFGTVTTGTAGAGPSGSFRIGRGDNAQFLNGDIAEILMYDRALSSLEQDSVASYLNTKYALGLAAVPEPSTIALVCGAGFLFLGLRRRRKA